MIRQRWVKPAVPGTDVVVEAVEVLVDERLGLAELVASEAVVAQVLLDAGWERAMPEPRRLMDPLPPGTEPPAPDRTLGDPA